MKLRLSFFLLRLMAAANTTADAKRRKTTELSQAQPLSGISNLQHKKSLFDSTAELDSSPAKPFSRLLGPSAVKPTTSLVKKPGKASSTLTTIPAKIVTVTLPVASAGPRTFSLRGCVTNVNGVSGSLGVPVTSTVHILRRNTGDLLGKRPAEYELLRVTEKGNQSFDVRYIKVLYCWTDRVLAALQRKHRFRFSSVRERRQDDHTLETAIC